MKLDRNEKIIFASVFIAHFIFAIASRITFGDHVFISHADSYYFYFQSAKNLLETGTLSIASQSPFYPDAYHTPVYSIFLAALLYLKLPFLLIIGAQNLIIAASAVIAYRIGIYLFDSSAVGTFAAIAAGIEPMAFYWGNLFMSDSLFSFLFLYAFYNFLKKKYMIFGLFMGIATLTRPIALYFFLIFAVLILIRNFIETGYDKERLKNNFRTIALTTVIFCATISPWIIRNKIQFNAAEISSTGWYQFYTVVGAPFAKENNISYPPAPKTLNDFDFTRFDFRYEKYYRDSFLNTISDRPFEYAYFHLKRSWISFWNHGYSYLAHYVIADKLPMFRSGLPEKLLSGMILLGNSLWIFIYAAAAYSFREKKYRIWLSFIFIPLLFNAIAAGIMNPEGGDMSRYMFPFTPLILLFSGMGIKMLISNYNFTRNIFAQA